jgi:hypothetical protein
MIVEDRARARRNVILGVVHALIALGILAAFAYVQSQR